MDEGTQARRYKNRTILFLSHFIIKFLWPCGLFSNIQVICSGVFLNRGCFSPFQKMSTDGDWFLKCWHPCLRKCSHLLCAEQVRQTNMMMRSSVSCRHAELIDRGKFNINHTFFQCLQFFNDVYLLDISRSWNFIWGEKGEKKRNLGREEKLGSGKQVKEKIYCPGRSISEPFVIALLSPLWS